MIRKWILLSLILSFLAGCDNYSSGDRVLVSKCSYDSGILPPRRYEVVVFKYPGHLPGEGPMDKNTPKNYIKRLLGLPGELLAIFFGRLYHRVPEPNQPPFFDDIKTGNCKDEKDLWKEPFMHVGEKPATDWFHEGKFTILRKPPSVMLALRRIVYDNDYQSKSLMGKLDRWTPAAGSTWKSDKATGFLAEGKAGDSVDWLRYQHLLRGDDPVDGEKKIAPMLILDTLDYNTYQTQNDMGPMHHGIYSQAHWVGDLMLEANVEVTEPKGELWFELSKGVDRFRACWDLASGQCTLFREGMDKKIVQLDQKPTRVKGPGNYMLRLANVDARLTVWVDRDLPFGEGVDYDPPEVRKAGENIDDEKLEERRGPTMNDLEPASLGNKGASARITHLRVWRDTYYRTRISPHPGVDYDHHATRDDWTDPKKFSEFRKQRFTTMYVQPGHYLCLGDNSQSSSDSRVWGLVPERLMLGRALMVYFPLERVGPIR